MVTNHYDRSLPQAGSSRELARLRQKHVVPLEQLERSMRSGREILSVKGADILLQLR